MKLSVTGMLILPSGIGHRQKGTGEQMKYQYWLANIPGVGSRTIGKLLKKAGSAQEIYFLRREQLEKAGGLSERQIEAICERKKEWDLDEKLSELHSRGITFLSFEMEDYPDQLKNISDPPYSLYIKGRMPDFQKKRAAIVGARMCSEYGKYMAEKLGEALSEHGVEVISGLAGGVDSHGHIGALRGKEATYAVLGCGVDVCYPQYNRKLYGEILESGGILSEYPPDTAPLARLFPARNRIISALSDMVIIVEAKERSGSLITADYALEQGKDIYAVPGRVTDALSQGCNNLIKQGAGIINNVEDFLKDQKICMGMETKQENFNKLLLEKDESLVYACLSLRPKSLEEIIRQTGYGMPQIADILQRLIQKEFVTETFKNYYIRKI